MMIISLCRHSGGCAEDYHGHNERESGSGSARPMAGAEHAGGCDECQHHDL